MEMNVGWRKIQKDIKNSSLYFFIMLRKLKKRSERFIFSYADMVIDTQAINLTRNP